MNTLLLRLRTLRKNIINYITIKLSSLWIFAIAVHAVSNKHSFFYSHYNEYLGSLFLQKPHDSKLISLFIQRHTFTACFCILAEVRFTQTTSLEVKINSTFSDKKHYYFVLTFYILKLGNFVRTLQLRTLTVTDMPQMTVPFVSVITRFDGKWVKF